MSKFDVQLASTERSRTLSFMIAIGVGLLVLVGVVFSISERSASVAMADSTEFIDEIDANTPLPETASPSTASQTLGTDIPAEHAAHIAPAAFSEHDFFAAKTNGVSVERVDMTVRRGQTFASVLDRAGASRVDAARAIAALEPLFSARDLRAGQNLSVFMETRQLAALETTADALPRLAGFSFRPDSERTLTVARSGDSFRAREANQALTRELVRVRGEVSSSLYMAAIEAGATDRIVVELAKILGFAVDFRTIQPGDDFDIVFERFVNPRGETQHTGNIAYLYFDGRRDPLEYYRFESEDGPGYYTAEGESAQRLLMKMPINGARISSSFGMRFHPVLATNRPHNGTDFAAPRGTPIMAAGNGVVERANRFGSFGNYIRIRHSNGYQTAYAHLRGFARGIRAGSRVTQGQTIGYVGTTGRSTGPHLHYEVHLNGRPTNPMALDLPTGRTLEDGEMGAFIAERDRIRDLRDQAPFAGGEDQHVVALDPDAT